MKKIETLVKTYVKKGFRFHTVKVGRPYVPPPGSKPPAKPRKPLLWEFDEIAKWGEGKSIFASFSSRYVPYFSPPGRGVRIPRIAPPPEGENPFGKIIGEIIRSSLNEDYRDRVDPLIPVILEFIESGGDKDKK